METVKELLVILIGSSLVSNVVLSQFLGLCPFLGCQKRPIPLRVWERR